MAVHFIALLAFAGAQAGQAPAPAPACIADGEAVHVSGKVALVSATDVLTNLHYDYPVLQLDRPLCYRSAKFGDVADAQSVAIIAPPTGPLADVKAHPGEHLALQGRIVHSTKATQPPADLLLVDPAIER